MPRWSPNPESGSALVESVAIGSFVFLVVLAAVSTSVDMAVTGGRLYSDARAAVVQAARYAGPEAAEHVAGPEAVAVRDGDSLQITMTQSIEVPHPDGVLPARLVVRAEMPMAPFRSARE